MIKDKPIVTKDMTLGEIAERYPEAVGVLFSYGMRCIGCHVAAWETIEQGAKAHGLDDSKLSKLLEDINKAISEGEKVPE